MGAPPQLLPLSPAGWLLPPPWQLLLQQCRAGQAALATLAYPCSPHYYSFFPLCSAFHFLKWMGPQVRELNCRLAGGQGWQGRAAARAFRQAVTALAACIARPTALQVAVLGIDMRSQRSQETIMPQVSSYASTHCLARQLGG